MTYSGEGEGGSGEGCEDCEAGVGGEDGEVSHHHQAMCVGVRKRQREVGGGGKRRQVVNLATLNRTKCQGIQNKDQK